MMHANAYLDERALVAALEELAAEVHNLALLVGQVAANTGVGEWLRTGAMCKFVGVNRSTLYSWDRAGLVGRAKDALGEVVWNRDEVLRVLAGHRARTRGHHTKTGRNGSCSPAR